MDGSLPALARRCSLLAAKSPRPKYIWKSSIPAKVLAAKKCIRSASMHAVAVRNTEEFLYESQKYIRTIRKPVDLQSMKFTFASATLLAKRPMVRRPTKRTKTLEAEPRTLDKLSQRVPQAKSALGRKVQGLSYPEVEALRIENGTPVVIVRKKTSRLLLRPYDSLTTRHTDIQPVDRTPTRQCSPVPVERPLVAAEVSRDDSLCATYRQNEKAMVGWKIGVARRYPKHEALRSVDSSFSLKISRAPSALFRTTEPVPRESV